VVCGFPITLLESDAPPNCPRCGETHFEAASLFSDETTPLPAPPPAADPAWLSVVRTILGPIGPHLAWTGEEAIETAFIDEGFTRIGRSLRADVRLGDPTVSRRHALLHRDGSTCIALDDRSLNGVFVNGKRIDWQPLRDGDEIEVGSFRLHFLDPNEPRHFRPRTGRWHSQRSLPYR
jgi:hypothetical protein